MGAKVEEEGEREGEDDVIGKDGMVRKEEKEVLEMDVMMKELVDDEVLENGKLGSRRGEGEDEGADKEERGGGEAVVDEMEREKEMKGSGISHSLTHCR